MENTSNTSKIKELQILLAMESGEITEQQAAEVLGLYRLEVRTLRLRAIASGIKMVTKSEPDNQFVVCKSGTWPLRIVLSS